MERWNPVRKERHGNRALLDYYLVKVIGRLLFHIPNSLFHCFDSVLQSLNGFRDSIRHGNIKQNIALNEFDFGGQHPGNRRHNPCQLKKLAPYLWRLLIELRPDAQSQSFFRFLVTLDRYVIKFQYNHLLSPLCRSPDTQFPFYDG